MARDSDLTILGRVLAQPSTGLLGTGTTSSPLAPAPARSGTSWPLTTTQPRTTLGSTQTTTPLASPTTTRTSTTTTPRTSTGTPTTSPTSGPINYSWLTRVNPALTNGIPEELYAAKPHMREWFASRPNLGLSTFIDKARGAYEWLKSYQPPAPPTTGGGGGTPGPTNPPPYTGGTSTSSPPGFPGLPFYDANVPFATPIPNNYPPPPRTNLAAASWDAILNGVAAQRGAGFQQVPWLPPRPPGLGPAYVIPSIPASPGTGGGGTTGGTPRQRAEETVGGPGGGQARDNQQDRDRAAADRAADRARDRAREAAERGGGGMGSPGGRMGGRDAPI